MQQTVIRARRNESLTEDQLRRYVPALYAEQPHESRSSRYVYIPTQNVLRGLVDAGFMPVEARQSVSRDEGKRPYTKHLIRFRSSTAGLQVNDTFFEVILRNGHDGSAAYEFSAGLFRLLCLNGMATKHADFENHKVRHSGNAEKTIREVIEGAQIVLQQGPKVLEKAKQWSEIELTRDEQGVFADTAHHLRFADSEGKVDTAITASQLLRPRRPADQRNDLWTTFNVIQENAVKGGLSAIAHGRRQTTREIKGIDQDLKLNRALWVMAERMAELKQAA